MEIENIFMRKQKQPTNKMNLKKKIIIILSFRKY